jgi:hypothetical protein
LHLFVAKYFKCCGNCIFWIFAIERSGVGYTRNSMHPFAKPASAWCASEIGHTVHDARLKGWQLHRLAKYREAASQQTESGKHK